MRIQIVKTVLVGFLAAMAISGKAFAGIQRFPIAADPSKNEMAMSADFDGTNYLVPVMSDFMVADADFGFGTLEVQFVSQQGTLVGAPVPVASSAYGILDAGVAYGGGKYLLIWEDGILCGQGTISATINAVFVTPDGTVGTPFTIAYGHSIWNPDQQKCESTVDVPGVLYAGGKFFVLYEDDPENGQPYITCVPVGSDGAVGAAFTVSQSPGRFHMAQEQIASGGSSFLVVYNKDDDYDTKVLGRLVDAESGPVGPEMTIDGSSCPSDNPSSVIFDGEKYCVVWTDEVSGPTGDPEVWHFYGNFVSTSGSVSEKFPVSVVNGFKIAPFISHDGEKYLVTWTDGRNCSSAGCSGTGMDIYGQIVNTDGSMDGPEFAVSEESGNELGGFTGQFVSGKAFGLINTNLQLPDFRTDDVYGAFWNSEITPPAISSVQKRTAPFRLRIYGSNFHPDAKVYIGGDPNPWPTVKYGNATMLTLMKGASLKARFPAGVPVEIKVVNGDGGTATATYTR